MVMSKVKSRSHHDLALLHFQPISLPSITFLQFTTCEIQSGQHDIAYLSLQPNVPTKYQLSTPYTYHPENILQVKGTRESNVTSKSHYDTAHTPPTPHPPTPPPPSNQYPYQVSTSYILCRCSTGAKRVGNNVYKVGCSFPACQGESVKFQTCLIFL